MHGRAVREMLSDICIEYCSSVTARKLLIVPLYIYTHTLIQSSKITMSMIYAY
jgi:hypothetical protein